MTPFHIDEYAVKKHFLTVFVCLLLGAIAFVYLQGEHIFISVIGAHVPKDSLFVYHNDRFEFAVSYPSRYLVGEEGGEESGTVYFTERQDPPFYLRSSPHIYSEEGDWREYLAKAEQRKNSKITSVRNITVGDAIFAKEIISAAKDGKERIKEVIFGRLGKTYVILQRYGSSLDPIYPLLVKTFQFK